MLQLVFRLSAVYQPFYISICITLGIRVHQTDYTQFSIDDFLHASSQLFLSGWVGQASQTAEERNRTASEQRRNRTTLCASYIWLPIHWLLILAVMRHADIHHREDVTLRHSKLPVSQQRRDNSHWPFWPKIIFEQLTCIIKFSLIRLRDVNNFVLRSCVFDSS